MLLYIFCVLGIVLLVISLVLVVVAVSIIILLVIVLLLFTLIVIIVTIIIVILALCVLLVIIPLILVSFGILSVLFLAVVSNLICSFLGNDFTSYLSNWSHGFCCLVFLAFCWFLFFIFWLLFGSIFSFLLRFYKLLLFLDKPLSIFAVFILSLNFSIEIEFLRLECIRLPIRMLLHVWLMQR